MYLGIQYYERRRLQDAQQELEAAAHIRLRDAVLQYHLAAIYAEQGRLEDAVESLEIVLWLDPLNAKAREHLMNVENMLAK
jgi:tetratricopeptide (TPR) repeat protein